MSDSQELRDLKDELRRLRAELVVQTQALHQHTQSNKVIADVLFENNQIIQHAGEELRGDRQLDHRLQREAVKALEEATGTLKLLIKHIDEGAGGLGEQLTGIQQCVYDMATTVDALRTQLVQPLNEVSETTKKGVKAAEEGAKAAVEGANHAKAARRRADDTAGKLDTMTGKVDAIVEEQKKSKTRQFIDIGKEIGTAFNKYSLSTRILLTILAIVLAGGWIVHGLHSWGVI